MSPDSPLSLSADDLKSLEESHVSKMIGPVIKRLYDAKARDVAFLSWNTEPLSREAARLLSLCLSHQLTRKCCMVLFEGVRSISDDLGGYTRLSLPEVELDSTELASSAKAQDAAKNEFPFRMIVGPSIETFDRESARKRQLTLAADAHVLVLPSSGVSRQAGQAIVEFTKRHKLKWFGMLLIEPPKQNASVSHE